MTLYHVSYMMSPRDNGHCLSFETQDAQQRAIVALRQDGAYHIHAWES